MRVIFYNYLRVSLGTPPRVLSEIPPEAAHVERFSMQIRTRASIIALIGALVLGGGYVLADGADLVPGIFTFKPPLPRVADFPTPKAVSPAPDQAPLFDNSAAPDPGFFKQLTREFVEDYRMKNAKVSWWIGTLDGVELAASNPDLALAPASTTKLFTAVAALRDFGASARARTLVAWDGAARKLYLIGGGDILLGAGADTPGDIFGYAGLETLAGDTVRALTKRSKNALAEAPYTLVVDTSWFGSEAVSTAWRPQDHQWVGPIQGLGINTGAVARGQYRYVPDAARVAGQAFADALGASGAAPAKIENGKSGLAKTEILDPATPLPEVSTAAEAPHESPTVVAAAQGAPFAQVIREMLKVSDNTLAETLGRLVALHRGSKPTFAASAKAVQSAVAELGIRLGDTSLAGCSGLAHSTRIPARVLTDVVRLAADPGHPELRAVLSNLPVAGADGTLKGAYRNTRAAGNLRGKTGTLAISNSLAGTMVYQNQVLVYALVISGYPEGKSGQTIAAKQMFLAGLLGGKTEFSPTDPKATQTPEVTAQTPAPPA